MRRAESSNLEDYSSFDPHHGYSHVSAYLEVKISPPTSLSSDSVVDPCPVVLVTG